MSLGSDLSLTGVVSASKIWEYANAALEYDGGMASVWDAWMKRNG